MAQAPRPGVTRRAEEADAFKQVMSLRIKDETRTLAIGSVPLKERLICRQATGLPFESFVGEHKFGVDSLMVLWWLAGRAGGDPFLTLEKVEAAWPDELEADDIEVSIDEPDPEDANPEA